MNSSVVLGGCSPSPLAGYLKALGVLRIVAEQADATATGHWRQERFVLGTCLPEEELADFFLNSYRPSPIAAPWNGGSGFYAGDNSAAMDELLRRGDERLAALQEVLRFCREEVVRGNYEERPDKEDKQRFLERLRSRAPETFLDWFDAAVTLTAEKAKFAPLLGTGGNDGRLDFTNNFMQRLVECLPAPDDGAAWLASRNRLEVALFGLSRPMSGVAVAVGQFHPGRAGGPNATQGYEGDAQPNPWDFILLLEGTLLFAGAVTRRLHGGGPGELSYPFTVQPTGSGSGQGSVGDEAGARAELWLPLWEAPAGLSELRALFQEGRTTVGRRPAVDGLDFARAVAGLGIDRGITAFERVGFEQRAGKSFLATPKGRHAVTSSATVSLVGDLESADWLHRVRRMYRGDRVPARLRSLGRRLEDALFDVTRGGGALAIQSVLVAAGGLQVAIGANPKLQEACPPLPLLSDHWISAANDGSVVFRMALALSGLHGAPIPLRCHISPVSSDARKWVLHSRLVCWKQRSLPVELAELERIRRHGCRKEGEDPSWAAHGGAPLDDVLALLEGTIDELAIAALVPALAHCRRPDSPDPTPDDQDVPPFALALLKPFFLSDAQLVRLRILPEGGRLSLPGELPALLMANRVNEALALAFRRLGAAGVSLPASPRRPPSSGHSGSRLLAAALWPLAPRALTRLLRPLAPPFANPLKPTETLAERN